MMTEFEYYYNDLPEVTAAKKRSEKFTLTEKTDAAQKVASLLDMMINEVYESKDNRKVIQGLSAVAPISCGFRSQR